MRVVFAGTPEVALPSLEALLASDHEVVAVVTRPDAPGRRGRQLIPSPVAARALELGLEVLRPGHPREADFQQRLRELAPDICAVVAYGALVPEVALSIPRHGWVNLHFSLLPAWRGAAPVQRAIMAGDPVTGATTFSLVAGLDAGPTYLRLERPIQPTDTSGALLGALADEGAQLLVRTLDGIADGSVQATDQPDVGITLAPKITVDDARIDWTQSAEVLDRQIRGCTPAPGAWCEFRGERFKVGPATITQDRLATGELVTTKNSVLVGTATTALALGQVKAFGKKEMAAPDWARGIRIEPGERLS